MHPTLLCLHGWGGSKESFGKLREGLQGSNLRILTPDLPGFGAQPDPPNPWTVDDYAHWVKDYIRKETKHGEPLLLLGHSHGGRIALVIAAEQEIPLAHLFLCAAAGIRHPRHLKRFAGLMLAKAGKGFLSIPFLRPWQSIARKALYRLVRVHDYEHATPVMQDTLRLVTQRDLRNLLPAIQVPTDIFWGTDDLMTPVQDAHLMHARIPGSHLHLFPGIRHAVHQEKAPQIAQIIRTRIASLPSHVGQKQKHVDEVHACE